MLKIRLMGTKNDIKWFGKILQRNPKVEVTEFSDTYPNKGTKKYYRAYVEVKEKQRSRKIAENRGECIMCKIIAIANQKGGVAKTTTTINLGVGLGRLGKKVLLVDADPQGHLTMGMGFPKNIRVTLKSMMENIIMGIEFDPKEAVLKHQEGVDIIPANKLLAGMDMSLFTIDDREMVLKEYLQLLEKDYDYIIIDCMPSLGMLTINALSAANSVLIPVQPQYYAADGLTELLKVVNGIKQRFNPELDVEGILFTMDSSRYNNSKRNKNAIRTAYGNQIHIFENSIPRLEAIAETASEGISIFAYDSLSKGAGSYEKLVQEVLSHA